MNPSPQVTLQSDQLDHWPYSAHALSPHASTSSEPSTKRVRVPPPPQDTVHGVHSPKLINEQILFQINYIEPNNREYNKVSTIWVLASIKDLATI